MQSQGKHFVEPGDVPTTAEEWGVVKWLSAPDVTGAARFGVAVVVVESGKGHMMHNHPGVEQVICFISGEGEQTVADERRHVVPGMLVHIPPDIDHETMNTGWEPLKFISIYSPPMTA